MPAQAAASRLSPVRRAVGIIRVSKVGDRHGDRFVSPTDQRNRLEDYCRRENIALVEIHEELDISAGDPLLRRPGLRRGIELVEAGEIDLLVVAYFDRLVRSLEVQAQILKRIEKAGGMVVALDFGEIRTDTAARWLSSTMLGMVAEYHRRITSEKVREAKHDALMRGVPPFPNIVAGYRRGSDGRLEVVPNEAALVLEAYRMRARGASLSQIRDWLRGQGLERSYRATQTMLESRLVLGEIHYDGMVNLQAHPPIVDRALWQQVQGIKLPRGRASRSERLLARLGVLRCASCGARMVTATMKPRPRMPKRFPIYRCGMPGDCPKPTTISATMIEDLVIAKVRELLEDESETASMDTQVTEAEDELARRTGLLEAAVTAFEGIDVAIARKRLLQFQQDVDEARERVAALRAARAPAAAINASADWNELSFEGRRALIRASLERVTIVPGRGTERVTFQPFT